MKANIGATYSIGQSITKVAIRGKFAGKALVFKRKEILLKALEWREGGLARTNS